MASLQPNVLNLKRKAGRLALKYKQLQAVRPLLVAVKIQDSPKARKGQSGLTVLLCGARLGF